MPMPTTPAANEAAGRACISARLCRLYWLHSLVMASTALGAMEALPPKAIAPYTVRQGRGGRQRRC